MKIHLVQEKPEVGSIKANLEKILKEFSLAKKADIMCFPELFLCGYPIEDRIFFSDFKQQIQNALKKILKESCKFDFYIILPLPIFEKNDIYNGVVVLQKGKILEKIKKIHLPNYGVFDENRYFKKGTKPKIIKILGKKIAISICEDIWHKEYVTSVKKLKPDLIFSINASPFEKGKFEKRISCMKQFNCDSVYLNQVLGYDEIIFEGRSFGLNSKGEQIFEFTSFEEESKMIDFSIKEKIFYQSELELIYKGLVFGLSEYLFKNKITGVLVGLSGGIDSALVTKIAIDAIGASNVTPVILPSKISSKESIKDANDFLKLNKLKAIELSIKESYDIFEKQIKIKNRLSKQNLQSRIRGLILMTISNETGKMLLTTGNKSELATGYCTIYGDMNGGFNPIKDLFKTEVFEICHFLNKREEVFPPNILKKPPTAELEESQTDEVALGMPYLVLDFILKEIIEEKASVAKIAKNFPYSPELDFFRKQNGLFQIKPLQAVQTVYDLIKKAEFKRFQSPPGTKISKCAFGRDWRFGATI